MCVCVCVRLCVRGGGGTVMQGGEMGQNREICIKASRVIRVVEVIRLIRDITD
jgi:hypothetical protein